MAIHPVEALFCGTHRFVFSTDWFLPAEVSNLGKYGRIVQLAVIWCSAIRDRCNLNMTDNRQEVLQPEKYVAFVACDMIAVEHEFQVRGGELGDDVPCLRGVRQEVSRCVMPV